MNQWYTSCAEEDIEPVASTLMFPPGSSEQCQSITIFNDGVREDDEENFSVTLTTSQNNTDVILQPNTTQILIIDNDSELNKTILRGRFIHTFMQQLLWSLIRTVIK